MGGRKEGKRTSRYFFGIFVVGRGHNGREGSFSFRSSVVNRIRFCQNNSLTLPGYLFCFFAVSSEFLFSFKVW